MKNCIEAAQNVIKALEAMKEAMREADHRLSNGRGTGDALQRALDAIDRDINGYRSTISMYELYEMLSGGAVNQDILE